MFLFPLASVLAASFFLSESYICRIFKQATGTTINQYITAKRISRAKILLAEGRTVTEACSLCGFGDYSNFLKSFTRAVGISPKNMPPLYRVKTDNGLSEIAKRK